MIITSVYNIIKWTLHPIQMFCPGAIAVVSLSYDALLGMFIQNVEVWEWIKLISPHTL